MLKEAVEFFGSQKGDVVVDATYGAGGHSRALKAAAKIHLIAIDADPAVAALHPEVITANFRRIRYVAQKNLPAGGQVDKALFDLGWNKGQLSAGKGFSFMTDEPLVMSYGTKPASGFTAAEVVNSWSEKSARGRVLRVRRGALRAAHCQSYRRAPRIQAYKHHH